MNPGTPSRWPAERLHEARAILRRHKDMPAALAEMSQRFGFGVTFPAIDAVLRKQNMGRAHLHLGRDLEEAPPAVPEDSAPTERQLHAAAFEQELPDDSWTTELAAALENPDADDAEESETEAELALMRAKRENAELVAARKRLLADLADAREQIGLLKELRAKEPLPPIEERAVVGATQRQGVPVLVCSDWHVEEPVDPKTVNGINEYSLDIADRCIERLVDAFEWLLRDARYDCRTAIIALLGDHLSGYIHLELEEKNFLSPTQAILWLADRIERMLRMIAKRCPDLERIVVACCDGNHGRNTLKIRVSTRTANSLEWLLYHSLAAKMADDPRFDFRIADGEWLFVEVYGKTLAFTHGDSFSYGGGVGGISIPIRRGIARQFQGQSIAKFCMGHFHQQQDFGDILINGSMIGPTPYSMRIHASPERRKQSWFLWDSRNGQALSAPIWL